MDWRSYIRTTLAADATLQTLLGGSGRIHGAGSVGEKVPGARPFIIIKHGPDRRSGNRIGTLGEAQIWAYDDVGSYLKIDAVLNRVKVLLDRTQVAQSGAITIEFGGDSADLSEPTWGTILRYSTYSLVGRKEGVPE